MKRKKNPLSFDYFIKIFDLKLYEKNRIIEIVKKLNRVTKKKKKILREERKKIVKDRRI